MLENLCDKHSKSDQQVCKTTFKCFQSLLHKLLVGQCRRLKKQLERNSNLKKKCSGPAQARILSISVFQLECDRYFRKNAQWQPKPESHHIQLECNRIVQMQARGHLNENGRGISRTPFRGIPRLRASPTQNLINFQLVCNRNFKEAAQSQSKSASH